jgi:hypothetical protein
MINDEISLLRGDSRKARNVTLKKALLQQVDFRLSVHARYDMQAASNQDGKGTQ